MAESIHYEINHATTYKYDADVSSCIMSVCMEPRHHTNQTVRDFRIHTHPSARFSIEFDAFHNRHHFFDIHQPHSILEIAVHATIIRQQVADFQSEPIPAESAWRELASWKSNWDLWEFLGSTELTEASSQLLDWLSDSGLETIEDPHSRLYQLAKELHQQFEYQPGTTHVDSTISHFLQTKAGVCQDFAHMMLAVARHWGIPARYISGYLYDEKDEQSRANNATHAWIECRLPGIGWMEFDPTNPEIDKNNLITVAIGRDYRDVAPSRGVTFGGVESDLEVGVSVKRHTVTTERDPLHAQFSSQQ